jgi:hypothetical protein
MKSLTTSFQARLFGILAALAFMPAIAMAADSAPASAKAGADERPTYDDSRMRPRDDAKTHGSGYAPVEYDDARMRPGEAAKGSEGKGADRVEYDESRMRPVEK